MYFDRFSVLGLTVFSVIAVVFSYQMDFRAFYIAGESVKEGLNVYLNNEGIGLIDCCEERTVSRFIYPPLSAYFFSVVSAMDYFWAKLVWTIILLAGFIKLINSFALPSWLLLSFPVLYSIERGQIDIVVLWLIVYSFRTKSPLISSTLFFISVLLKLFPIMLLPLIIWRWWKKDEYRFVANLFVFGILLSFLPSFSENWDYLNFFISRAEIDRMLPQNLDCRIIDNWIFLKEGKYFMLDYIHGQLNVLSLFKGYRIFSFALWIGLVTYVIVKCKQWDEKWLLLLLPILHLANDKVWIMTIIYFLPFFSIYIKRNKYYLGFVPLFIPPLGVLDLFIFPMLCLLVIIEIVHETRFSLHH